MKDRNATDESNDAEILSKTSIFGDDQHGLTVSEIAELLFLQEASVRIYMRDDKRRIDMYRRLFEEDEAVKEKALRILNERRTTQR